MGNLLTVVCSFQILPRKKNLLTGELVLCLAHQPFATIYMHLLDYHKYLRLFPDKNGLGKQGQRSRKAVCYTNLLK